jgi:hypothetical protein
MRVTGAGILARAVLALEPVTIATVPSACARPASPAQVTASRRGGRPPVSQNSPAPWRRTSAPSKTAVAASWTTGDPAITNPLVTSGHSSPAATRAGLTAIGVARAIVQRLGDRIAATVASHPIPSAVPTDTRARRRRMCRGTLTR